MTTASLEAPRAKKHRPTKGGAKPKDPWGSPAVYFIALVVIALTVAPVAYIVLGCAALFEGTSWAFALREFHNAKGSAGYFEAVRQSKDPPTFIVLLEDSAALVGLLIAFLGTFFASHLDLPVLDGAASLGIALVLGITALMLARESKGLLIGEPASRELRQAIQRTASRIDGIEHVQIVFTVHMAPDQVVVAVVALLGIQGVWAWLRSQVR